MTEWEAVFCSDPGGRFYVKAETRAKAKYKAALVVVDALGCSRLEAFSEIKSIRKSRRPPPVDHAAVFNERWPVGTLARYWTGVREDEGKVAKTRSPAANMPSGHASVWLEGEPGCVSLTHVDPLEAP